MEIEEIISYASAANDIATLWSVDNYKSVILPGRGAIPLYRIADSLREYHHSDVCHRHLTLPFTADENILPTQISRTHFVKVLKAFCKGKSNENFEFHSKINQRLGGPRLEPSNLGRILFIDTAISGRSATEIAHTLEDEKIDYHLALVCEDLKQPYKRYLENLESQGKATLFQVKRIYTEDKNPVIMGSGTVLLPNWSEYDKMASYFFELPFPKLAFDIKKINDPLEFTSALSTLHFYASQFVHHRSEKGVLSKESAIEAEKEMLRLFPIINTGFSRYSSKRFTETLAQKLGNTKVTSSHIIHLYN